MADEPETGTPGEPAAGAAGADDENAALIAELDAEQGRKPAGGKPTKKPIAAKKPDAEADDEEAVDVADDGDGEAAEEDEAATPGADEEDDELEDDDENEEESDEDGPDDELDAEAAKDPALKKRLDAVRRTELRQRQRLTAERAAFERERSGWQTETQQLRAAVTRIEGLAARAKIDPISLLEAHGLGADDMEYVSQLAYARSKAAAGKPEYRAAAERAVREREASEKVTTAEKRIADLEKKLEAKETQAAAERDLDAYFDRAFRKATDATPITARLIAKRPKAARAELAVTATQLVNKLGRMPKASELLAAHEKREVRALKLRGIKPPEPGAGKPVAQAAGKPSKPAAAAKPAAGKPAATEADVDDVKIPSAAELVRELAAAQRN
jgi:hypothetical protein